MHETGKSKTCVWRCQERFAAEGFEGLLRDKTRPSRIKKLEPSIAQRAVALTMEPPLAEATHWTGAAMADAVGVSVSSVQRIWRAHGPQPIAGANSSCRRTPSSSTSCATASMSIRGRTPWCSASREEPIQALDRTAARPADEEGSRRNHDP